MKMHFTFYISLLLFSKHDLMKQQVSELLFVIVESEKNLYFVDSIDDMKWWIQEVQFELLIKWEKYEQKTWELYTTIKKMHQFWWKNFMKIISHNLFQWNE